MATIVAVQGLKYSGTHAQGTALSSAQTISVPSGASHLIIQALTNKVRIDPAGGSVSTSYGFELQVGEIYQFPVTPGGSFKAIEVTASASIEYQFQTHFVG